MAPAYITAAKAARLAKEQKDVIRLAGYLVEKGEAKFYDLAIIQAGVILGKYTDPEDVEMAADIAQRFNRNRGVLA